jgi:hypothetical protein
MQSRLNDVQSVIVHARTWGLNILNPLKNLKLPRIKANNPKTVLTEQVHKINRPLDLKVLAARQSNLIPQTTITNLTAPKRRLEITLPINKEILEKENGIFQKKGLRGLK